ncbi:MAG: T9SS type A sorting domain-containing protein [candidate division WOR-3 bacterium]|nr:T9SS type A sorting domain-containing protein [candidate division WOR-3 bacterium]
MTDVSELTSGIINQKLEINPNPARKYFTICGRRSIDRIRIYDITGRVVKEEKFKSSKGEKEPKVSLDGIKNGVYFIKADNSNQTVKIIITR